MRMCRRILLLATLASTSAAAQGGVAFTREQADQGSALYSRHCASCHGAQLTSGSASPLTGPPFRARWGQPTRTVDDLFYVMRTSMPFGAGGTLSNDEYLAILAYMLERNGHQAGARPL